MDGKEYERDDLGDTQVSYRFGQDPNADEVAYPGGAYPGGVWPVTGGGGSPEPGTRSTGEHRAVPRWGDTTDAGQDDARQHDPGQSPPYAPSSYPAAEPLAQRMPGFARAETDLPHRDTGQHDLSQHDPSRHDLSQHHPSRHDLSQTDPIGYRATGYPQPVGDLDAATTGEGSTEQGLSLADTGERRRLEPGGSPDRDSTAPGWQSTRRSRNDDGPDEFGGRRRAFRSRRTMPLWKELPLLLVVAFCLAVLIRTFLLQAFSIPSSSMEETLLVGDRVLVNKIVYDVRQPARGEVIVFSGPPNWVPENPRVTGGNLLTRVGRTLGDLVGMSRPGEKDYIKRVIAVAGDRVSCCDPAGRIYVNGKGIDEPYINVNSPLDVEPNPRSCSSRRFDEVLVPPGQLFVMGDNRIVSEDSRCQGTVPVENVIGRAFAIVWPGGRWDSLSVPETFEGVPGPVAMAPAAVPVGLAGGGAAGGGAAVATLPILASLASRARSGRKRRWGRRTLRT